MRKKEGCGLGVHILPYTEHTTIRERVANKHYRSLTSTGSHNIFEFNTFVNSMYISEHRSGKEVDITPRATG